MSVATPSNLRWFLPLPHLKIMSADRILIQFTKYTENHKIKCIKATYQNILSTNKVKLKQMKFLLNRDRKSVRTRFQLSFKIIHAFAWTFLGFRQIKWFCANKMLSSLRVPLRPFLFYIFHLTNNMGYLAYANDTQLYISVPPHSWSPLQLQQGLYNQKVDMSEFVHA